ncbi:MAG: acyltransferase [Devosia nanyangense]|uniref:Acyltransferase n=1 Tax=Devosia nanyangense TaxID=1228055 RepID=A0A933P0T1_9HYPH|nr:acyltransferase [Devosia nanyangense]
MASVRVASVQFWHRANDKAYNLGVVESFARKAARQGAAFVAFPEMCITGYWHVPQLSRTELAALAEDVATGPSIAQVKSMAAKWNIGIGVGLVERAPDGKLYNSYVAVIPDGTLHIHRKLHAFEHADISSGDSFTVFETPWGVRMGILICYDNNHIENGRATALLGADVLIAPHQTGGCNSASPHAMRPIDVELWRNRAADPAALKREFRGPRGRGWLMRWLPSRAHDNGMFLIFSNGVGEDNGEVRTGNAMILDCYGRIVTETSAVGDAMVVADLDLDLQPLCSGRRWLRGRRPELYGELTAPRSYTLSPLEVRSSSAPVKLDASS